MRIQVNWHKLNPSSGNGYGVQVINTFTSQSKEEIDNYIEWLKERFGDGFVCEDNSFEHLGKEQE